MRCKIGCFYLSIIILLVSSCKNLPQDTGKNDLSSRIEKTIEYYFSISQTPETTVNRQETIKTPVMQHYVTPTQQLIVSLDFDSYLATSETINATNELRNSQATAEAQSQYDKSLSGQSESSPAQTADPNIISYNSNPAFTEYAGTAPGIDNSSGDGAELISFSPENKHTFCAYDHSEIWQITFTNTGSTTWDQSFRLNFYKGYNWTSSNAHPLTKNVEPGGSYTFELPFTIHEDNDIWYTCWYLTTGNGKSISDFCYDFYTNSSYGC